MARVVDGNLSLVPADADRPGEREDLISFMQDFKILPAGRHLWASGVKGRQYLFNCHIAPWDVNRPERHYSFVFLRLMEGGGVGANYSDMGFKMPDTGLNRPVSVHIVCDPGHADYEAMDNAGVLSSEYTSQWDGGYQVEDSREGWAEALEALVRDAYDPDRIHQARVFDVSRVRPSGARLKTFGGTASGPSSLARMLIEVGGIINRRAGNGGITAMDAMEIDHAVAECVVSGGVRRSARMAMLHWKDPEVMEFIHCKKDTGKHWTTNVSVIVDQEFMCAVSDSSHPLNVHASMVMEEVCKGMLENGEPGFFNLSLAQVGEVDPIEATNPCGEIPGPQMMACCLGHVNMQAFVNPDGSVDYAGLEKAHRLISRFLVRATFGDFTDPEQQAVMRRERRIGVGHFGVQGHLNLRGIRYTDAPFTGFPNLLTALYETVRAEVSDYCFELRIPESIKVTTVAPTGSIAKLPGVPEGDQAIYGRYFNRRIRFSKVDPDQAAQVETYSAQGYQVEDDIYAANTSVVTIPTKDSLLAEVEARGLDPNIVESQDQISLEQSIAFQAMYQTYYADNAVSHTVNVREGSVNADELKRVLIKYLPNLKGTTIMVDSSRPQSPYERITREQYEDATAKAVSDSIDEECATSACPIR